MNSQERYSLMYRIIQGQYICEILGKKYIIKSPNYDTLLSAQYFYQSIVQECKYNTWITADDCRRCLQYNGLWGVKEENRLAQLNKDVEQCKIDIYKAFFNSLRKIGLKKDLEKLNGEIKKLEDISHCLDYFTIDGFATILQQQYILINTIYTMDNRLVFEDVHTTPLDLLNMFHMIILDDAVAVNDYRELARNEPWLSAWKIGQRTIFGANGMCLTTEQRNLVLYSLMYDSVYESADTPHKDIIEDDDALDGWFLEQKRKRDEEKRDKSVQDITNVAPNAQEVFLVANTPEDIERINNMNPISSKIIKSQRQAVIKQRGSVKDAQLPDKQLEIRQMAMEQLKGKHYG